MAASRRKRMDLREEPEDRDSSDSDGDWGRMSPSKKRSRPQKNKTRDDHADLPEYEKIRLKNIQERDKFLQSLAMDSLFDEMDVLLPKTPEAPKKEVKHIGVSKTKKREKLPVEDVVFSMTLRSREPKFKPDDSFSINYSTSIDDEEPIKDERLLGSLPMKLEEETLDDFFGDLKSQLKTNKKLDPNVDLSSCDLQRFDESINCLKMARVLPKVVSGRIQSLCVHPTDSKRLIIAGSVAGHIGLWDMDIPYDSLEEAGNNGLAQLQPHLGPTNCLSVSPHDGCKIYSTSHDGTVVCADLDRMIFDNIFATDFDAHPKHLTWHKERDADTLLIGHGNGSVGILDRRKRLVQRVSWVECFARSVRTVDVHPTNDNYFLVSSGTGGCRIYDLRNVRRKNSMAVCDMSHPKGLTSAFFSGTGASVLTTCNDDLLRVYDVGDLTKGKPRVKSKAVHNNHTGRWLSVFKAIWYPSRDDAFLIGSLMNPRRIQIYSDAGKLMNELRDEDMLTISPVLAVHPRLPLIVGGNSSGKVHAFHAD